MTIITSQLFQREKITLNRKVENKTCSKIAHANMQGFLPGIKPQRTRQLGSPKGKPGMVKHVSFIFCDINR